MQKRSTCTIVQEDKAPSYASKYQEPVFMETGILCLLWPGNSPNLNMIEPCWSWMKRKTTKRGPPLTRADTKKAWSHCWLNQLKQHRIQG